MKFKTITQNLLKGDISALFKSTDKHQFASGRSGACI